MLIKWFQPKRSEHFSRPEPEAVFSRRFNPKELEQVLERRREALGAEERRSFEDQERGVGH